MNVVILKYNAGNIQSVSYALERLNINFSITANHEEIQKADKVIFPGVGEASTTMNYLRDHKLDQVLKNLKQPVLGICLGMQLLCTHSEENNTPCLGIFDVTVKRFQSDNRHKVPHMGWNKLLRVRDWTPSSIENAYAYFVHSYYIPVFEQTTAETEYAIHFSAAMRKNNFYAVQFHPEKSGDTGTLLFKKFLDL
jgi:imidazole glycerol-phosphate synthase subunit HisH